MQTPYRAPNANAYAERFVRSIKEECLNRVIPIGDRHLRRMIAEYVEHTIASGITKAWPTVDRGCFRGGRKSRPHSPALAARRAAQLLLSRGVTESADQCDGSAHE